MCCVFLTSCVCRAKFVAAYLLCLWFLASPERRFFFFLMIRRPPRSTLDRSSQRQMCIRDSASAARSPAGRVRVLASDPTCPVALGKADTRAPGPVSYTHLRAHETVLDLVCRLLLEKKKTTQSITTTKGEISNSKNHNIKIHNRLSK